MGKGVIAYIALGSNIEPREGYLNNAIQALSEHQDIEVVNQSAVYETVPKGYTDQADFLNMVVVVQTDLDAHELLDVCQAIELDLKRVRKFKDGPRTIDLDILLFGAETIETDRLTVPHPRLHERAFVLFPLAEVAPGVVVPHLANGPNTVQELRDALPDSEKADVHRYLA